MFRAIGIFILLVAIRLLLPGLFHGVEHTFSMFFGSIGQVLAHGPTSVTQDATQMTAGYIVQSAPLPH